MKYRFPPAAFHIQPPPGLTPYKFELWAMTEAQTAHEPQRTNLIWAAANSMSGEIAPTRRPPKDMMDDFLQEATIYAVQALQKWSPGSLHPRNYVSTFAGFNLRNCLKVYQYQMDVPKFVQTKTQVAITPIQSFIAEGAKEDQSSRPRQTVLDYLSAPPSVETPDYRTLALVQNLVDKVKSGEIYIPESPRRAFLDYVEGGPAHHSSFRAEAYARIRKHYASV